MGLLYSLALSLDFLILQDFLNILGVLAKLTVPLYITLSRHQGEVTADINIHQPGRGHGNRKKVQRGFLFLFQLQHPTQSSNPVKTNMPSTYPGEGWGQRDLHVKVREKPESRAGQVRPQEPVSWPSLPRTRAQASPSSWDWNFQWSHWACAWDASSRLTGHIGSAGRMSSVLRTVTSHINPVPAILRGEFCSWNKEGHAEQVAGLSRALAEKTR